MKRVGVVPGLVAAACLAPTAALGANEVRAEPPAVTIVATRTYGPFGGWTGGRARVWLRDAPSGYRGRTLAGGPGGETVELTLSLERPDVRGLPAATRNAAVRPVGRASPGVYKGTFRSDGKATLGVMLKVRDHIVWPLLAVGVSALLAALVARAYDRRRRRVQLEGELLLLLETYEEELARQQRKLDEAFGAGRHPRKDREPAGLGWPSPDALPAKCGKAERQRIIDPVGDLETLWCQVKTAGLDEIDHLADATARVRSALDAWLELDVEIRRMAAAIERLGDRSSPIAEDARRLVARADATEAEEERRAVLVRLRRQANVIMAYARLEDELARADDRRPPARDAVSAAAHYGRAPAEALRTQEDTEALLKELGVAADTLARATRGGRGAADRGDVYALMSSPLSFLGDALSDLATQLVPARRPPRVDAPTSERVFAGLRRWSWAAAAVSGGLTVIAFVLPFYATDHFGSSGDYAAVVVAGLLGQAGGFLAGTRGGAAQR